MISIDRKVAAAVLRLTKSYDDEILCDSTSFHIVRNYRPVGQSVPVPVSTSAVYASLDRLMDAGYLRLSQKMFGGNFYFCITPRLLHRKAFWLDDFTKRFWGGFVAGLISGILITVIGGLLLAFLRSVLGI